MRASMNAFARRSCHAASPPRAREPRPATPEALRDMGAPGERHVIGEQAHRCFGASQRGQERAPQRVDHGIDQAQPRHALQIERVSALFPELVLRTSTGACGIRNEARKLREFAPG